MSAGRLALGNTGVALGPRGGLLMYHKGKWKSTTWEHIEPLLEDVPLAKVHKFKQQQITRKA